MNAMAPTRSTCRRLNDTEITRVRVLATEGRRGVEHDHFQHDVWGRVAVSCKEKERGWHLLQPLEGRSFHGCLIPIIDASPSRSLDLQNWQMCWIIQICEHRQQVCRGVILEYDSTLTRHNSGWSTKSILGRMEEPRQAPLIGVASTSRVLRYYRISCIHR